MKRDDCWYYDNGLHPDNYCGRCGKRAIRMNGGWIVHVYPLGNECANHYSGMER